MYIKQVIISGFRSFRSQSETEPFSPHHNVIVGRNGSGKSNFFDAIQFVLLSQRFTTLRPEERQHLLHEGAGANVMSAFVEIVFDNSDGRLAQDGDEVVLRRTIGLKKDEFFLNRKRVNKNEVSSLLESAGFSASNPYYIVQQGKVSTLTLMRDEERLNLLREIAGTKVYEERREESLVIMDETNSKRDKIQEVITYIEERLAELEEEKEELGTYQKLDRNRRALEYTLYDKELRKAREDLEQIEKSRSEDVDRTQEIHEAMRSVTDGIAKREADEATAVARLARLERQREEVERERREVIAARAKLELEVKDTQERVAADAEGQTALQRELVRLERTVAEREAELDRRAAPAYEAARRAVQETEARLAEGTAIAEELYAKQGRQEQFSGAEERDAFLRQQIAALEGAAAAKRKVAAEATAAARALQATVEARRREVRETEDEIKQRHEAVAKLSQDLARKTGERDERAEERKELWRRLEALQDKATELRAALHKAERDLRSSMPRHIAQGLEAVERLVRQENIAGYRGPVIDNFTLADRKFAMAVEVAGGNSLFHVIVDDDATAARLMERLEKGRLGRVTFMPLSRLRPTAPAFPDSQEVAPLLRTAIRHDPDVLPALQQIFGKKLLARNVEVAAQFAASANMDAITLEGDEVGRKGSLRGGYYEESSNRLLARERLRESRVELNRLQREQAELKAKAAEADQAVTGLLGEMEKLDARRTEMRAITDRSAADLKGMREAAVAAAEALAAKRDEPAALEGEARQEANRAALLAQELGTPLLVALTPDEKHRLAELNGTTLPALKHELQKRCDALEAAAAEKQRLQSLLSDNLLKRREDLVAQLDPEHGGVGSSHVMTERQQRQEMLAAKVQELERVTRQLEENRDRLAELEEDALKQRQQLRALQDALDQLRGREDADGDRLAEAAKMAERLLNKRALLLQKREDNTRKIQELGSLPGAELDAFKDLGAKQLMKKLHDVNEQLKKYSHVNKKALDQYVNFSEQRGTLLERKKELDDGAAAIEELVSALDRQKDEAILRTFKGVSHHFTQVFRELVPAGSGQLVIKTRADAGAARGAAAAVDTDGEDGATRGGAASGDENADPSSGKTGKGKGKGKAKAGGGGASGEPSMSEFTGVQVRVSFGGGGQVFLMSQLSGGQKALVALALIFAIQRCDPAPFYLFDEIDQALDGSYRHAVAALIQRQAHSSAEPTQFITTTFRPELVQVAARCYGISHQNKVSSIHELSKDEALAFVKNIMTEEEAVAEPTRRPGTASGHRSRRRVSAAGRGDAAAAGSSVAGSSVAGSAVGSVAGSMLATDDDASDADAMEVDIPAVRGGGKGKGKAHAGYGGGGGGGGGYESSAVATGDEGDGGDESDAVSETPLSGKRRRGKHR